MIYGILDALFFACITLLALSSCYVFLKKCKRDSRVQIVPVIVIELPRVPDLPDV